MCANHSIRACEIKRANPALRPHTPSPTFNTTAHPYNNKKVWLKKRAGVYSINFRHEAYPSNLYMLGLMVAMEIS